MQESQLESEIEADSMENYLNHAKQVNWHIDENKFPKLRELRDLNFDEEFNLYLGALLSKKCPWEEADMQFVDSVWEKNEFINKYGFIFSGSTLIVILLGFFTGYILNDIVGCFLVSQDTGNAIGTIIAIGILIVIIGFIPGSILAETIEGYVLSPKKSELNVNKLKILSDNRETARNILLVFSIVFVGWLVYFIFLRQWLWKDILHEKALLSYNYFNWYGICVVLVFLLIMRKKLIRVNTEMSANSIINQNREHMQTVITRANNYNL